MLYTSSVKFFLTKNAVQRCFEISLFNMQLLFFVSIIKSLNRVLLKYIICIIDFHIKMTRLLC